MSILETSMLGAYQAPVDAALDEMASQNIVQRIWQRDHTVWKPDPTEIGNRLGWLDIVDQIRINIKDLIHEAREAHDAGYTDALLLGMGGSSLAPDLFSQIFDSGKAQRLHVLDSTDPGAVLAFDKKLNLAKTLFIVSSKSGTTVEMLSFFKHFCNRTARQVGQDKAGEHFVAITDKGSHLASLSEQSGFRATFLNNPHIGGRYSALSFFGLYPAALAGMDLGRLLNSASEMMKRCGPATPIHENPAAVLGAVMGTLARMGRDKLTLIMSSEIAPFSDWVEQLVAESLGKDGTGILPVVREPLGLADAYGEDRLFVEVRLADKKRQPSDPGPLAALANAGHPLLTFTVEDRYDLGGQFFLWGMATPIAGHLLGVNPFDQPNVESAKKRATAMVKAYQETGQLPAEPPARLSAETLLDFLEQARQGDYVALQAFVTPDEPTTRALRDLRTVIRGRTGLATTVGYGPRYLHSTGQLHKGDAGNGLFVMFTHDPEPDLPIPDEAGSDESSMSFGVLELAQALGDKQALEDAGRRVIRFHAGQDVVGALKRLLDGLT